MNQIEGYRAEDDMLPNGTINPRSHWGEDLQDVPLIAFYTCEGPDDKFYYPQELAGKTHFIAEIYDEDFYNWLDEIGFFNHDD